MTPKIKLRTIMMTTKKNPSDSEFRDRDRMYHYNDIMGIDIDKAFKILGLVFSYLACICIKQGNCKRSLEPKI